MTGTGELRTIFAALDPRKTRVSRCEDEEDPTTSTSPRFQSRRSMARPHDVPWRDLVGDPVLGEAQRAKLPEGLDLLGLRLPDPLGVHHLLRAADGRRPHRATFHRERHEAQRGAGPTADLGHPVQEGPGRIVAAEPERGPVDPCRRTRLVAPRSDGHRDVGGVQEPVGLGGEGDPAVRSFVSRPDDDRGRVQLLGPVEEGLRAPTGPSTTTPRSAHRGARRAADGPTSRIPPPPPPPRSGSPGRCRRPRRLARPAETTVTACTWSRSGRRELAGELESSGSSWCGLRPQQDRHSSSSPRGSAISSSSR